MTNAAAAGALPPDWQDWLRTNVARGCSRASMRDKLLGGGFAAALADAALDAALAAGGRAAEVPRPLRKPLPHRDAHLVDCDGRAVRVVAELASPRIVVLDGLLDDGECDALLACAEARLAPSTVVDTATGRAVPHPERTSRGASFRPREFDEVARLEARIGALLDWPATHAEGLQVMRYGPGQEYRPHFDYFDPALPGSAAHLAAGGQRVATLVVYLSEPEAGGGTRFPTLGFEVRPRRGGAVYFENLDEHGQPDPRTLHAGTPVLRGVKDIATCWLRVEARG